MPDTKLLQTLIDGQQSIKKSLGSLEEKIEKGFKNVNKRLDKIGSSVAYLEDDTPTVKEHEGLEKRVSKLEHQITKS